MTKTEIEFVEGFDPACAVPACVKAASLNHRLAVIQHTYRPDSVDMYFDEALWRRLLQFAEQFGSEYRVGIIDRDWSMGAVNRDWESGRADEPTEADEISVDAFLAAWSRMSERDPPEYIMVRGKRGLVMCIATEYWTQVGGPRPYADSYTYSLFSKSFINALAVRFVLSAEEAQGWAIAQPISGQIDSVKRFEEILSRAPNRPPMPGDEIE